MADERGWERRDVVRIGGAVVVGSTVAGCLDEGGSGNGNSSESDPGNDTVSGNATVESDAVETDDDTEDESETTSDDEPTYTVSMPPVGEVEFDDVPKAWAANNGSWADMGIALGQEPPGALYLTSRYHTQYYDEIPGVSVDKSGMRSLWGDSTLDPEELMALGENVDVFVVDPNFVLNRADGWTRNHVDRIESAGTPFFGNSLFSRGYAWHDYDYLSLYEAFEKLSQVFREEERYEAFERLHRDFQSNVSDIVPAERPSVAILWPMADGEFLPYHISRGTSFKQWRDLGVRDALAENGVGNASGRSASIGYGTLLEIDPDYLMLRGHETKTAAEFRKTVLSRLESHDTASKLRAVRNGNVYRGGPLYQGPITNLVVTQRAAEQLYGVDEQLYDPRAVGDIVTGEF